MLQTRRQMIFQDSASSLNQKMKVSDIITEPMRIQHITPPRGSFVKEAAFQMEYVGLENSFLTVIRLNYQGTEAASGHSQISVYGTGISGG